jgi:3-methylcrotonyl-CoA carboxylase beta subunit
VHTRLSGVADHLADNDAHALELAPQAVANLNGPGRALPAGLLTPEDPLYDPAEIAGDHSGRPKPALRHPRGDRPRGRRLAVRRVQGALRHHARLRLCPCDGMPVGIIANNGVLFSESAVKAAHFVELCSQRKIPLVFLQNITGFMVGQKYEAGGIAKDGAKMVTAVATTKVPKITMIVGGSFGAGNYGMCGRAYSPGSCGPGPTAASR